MALKSTIYKATLGIADMDRPYYSEHNLTLARHPSETEQRLMVRLLAFGLYADERLEFGRGISSDGEPALWHKEGPALARLRNLRVFALSDEQSAALAAFADRNMSLQCTIDDGQVWITDGATTTQIELRELRQASG